MDRASFEIIGNVGKLEIKDAKNGKKIGLVSVATSERWKRDDGEWMEKTYWHRVAVFAPPALPGGGDGLQPARLTVDLLRPTAIAPLEVRTTVQREGRRIRLVDAELVQDDDVVSRASAVFLRRGEQPTGDIWTADVRMPPLPPDPGPLPDGLPMFVWGFGGEGSKGGTFGFAEWHDGGPKYAWVRQLRPLLAGEATSPFVEAAMAADATSALTHWGTSGLRYINADYTLSLTRLPEGPRPAGVAQRVVSRTHAAARAIARSAPSSTPPQLKKPLGRRPQRFWSAVGLSPPSK